MESAGNFKGFLEFLTDHFVGGWYTGTFIAITLALDRCLEVIAPTKAEILFKGKRTWIWVAFCVLYGQYAFWFQFPFLFNSHYMATFTDPHFGEKYSTPVSNFLSMLNIGRLSKKGIIIKNRVLNVF